MTAARIEKRKIKLHTYKVSYTSPLLGKEERKWVSVDDITSLTLGREKPKQKCVKLSSKKKIDHYKKYYIPMGRDDYAKAIETRVLNWFTILLEMAISNLLHYRTSQRDRAF